MTTVVMALAHRTWADGVKVGFAFSGERLSAQLRDDPTVDGVVLVDPLRSHLSRLVRRQAAPPFSDDPTRRHLRPYRWRRGEPTTREEAVAVYERLDRWLRARVDAADAVLVTSHPVLAAVADRRAWRDISFYAWDDFRGIPGYSELYGWAQGTLADRDVAVVGVSTHLVRAIGAPRSRVVPNGLVSAEFEHLPPVPSWFAGLPGRVAFYAGSLQNRVDVDVLTALVRDLGAGWTLVLVGPMQEPAWFAGLAAEPNVVIRGAEPRPSVLAMMGAADVCLVPHRAAGTESMSPLKLYEYLGAGAAVVASDIEPMRGLSPRCLLVPVGEPITEAVLEAAQLPPASPEEVRAFRARHDWSARYAAWREVVLGY